MATLDDFYKDFSEEQQGISLRVFDLALLRLLKKAYKDFDKKTKKEMDRVFSSGTDKEKEDFIEKYIPKLKDAFGQELKGIQLEIEKGLEAQIF